MKKLLIPILFLLAGLVYTAPGQAEDEVVPTLVKVAGTMDTNKDGKVDASETADAVSGEASVADIAADAAAVADAAKGLKDKEAPKSLVWMLFLATVFKVLLSLSKLVKAKTQWFKKKKAKTILKFSTLGLGAIAALLFNLVGGMGWMEAALILLSGPVAVAIHEYSKPTKDTPDDAQEKGTG